MARRGTATVLVALLGAVLALATRPAAAADASVSTDCPNKIDAEDLSDYIRWDDEDDRL